MRYQVEERIRRGDPNFILCNFSLNGDRPLSQLDEEAKKRAFALADEELLRNQGDCITVTLSRGDELIFRETREWKRESD